MFCVFGIPFWLFVLGRMIRDLNKRFLSAFLQKFFLRFCDFFSINFCLAKYSRLKRQCSPIKCFRFHVSINNFGIFVLQRCYERPYRRTSRAAALQIFIKFWIWWLLINFLKWRLRQHSGNQGNYERQPWKTSHDKPYSTNQNIQVQIRAGANLTGLPWHSTAKHRIQSAAQIKTHRHA